jgi:hypothetical protein
MGIEQLATIQLTHLNQDRPVVIRVVDIVHVDKEPNGGSEICLGVATGGWKVKVNEAVEDIQAAINALWDQACAHVASYLEISDGITAPGAGTGVARIYVDTADGVLKVVYADTTVKTIVVDT